MRLATGLMARGRLGSPEVLAAIGHAAEEAGMARVWFGDHVVYPVEYEPKYPSPTGRIGYNPAAPQLDVVVAMTWLCAATTRVGVGTSVMVVAERQPVWLAKQLASLDRLSGGRVSLGIGVGWCAEEYAALGVPFARRGARTDEYIRAMQTLWTEEQPAFDGEFVSFPPLYCNPKPARVGGIPLWVGGFGSAAFDRVARYGTGWVAGKADPAVLASSIREIRARAADLGRDPDAIEVTTQIWQTDRAELGAMLRALRDVGVTEACVPVQGKDPSAVTDYIRSIPDLLEAGDGH